MWLQWEGRAVSFLLLAASLALVGAALTMPMGSIVAPGAGLVPLIFAGGTALCAGGALLWNHGPSAESESRHPSTKTLCIIAVLGGIILALEVIGYVASTAIGSFALLKFVERRSWLISISISIVLSIGGYLLFVKLLRVSLP